MDPEFMDFEFTDSILYPTPNVTSFIYGDLLCPKAVLVNFLVSCVPTKMSWKKW